jgi:maltose-binding protein MalE
MFAVRLAWTLASVFFLISAGMYAAQPGRAVAWTGAVTEGVDRVRLAKSTDASHVTAPKLQRGITVRIGYSPFGVSCLQACYQAIGEWERRAGDHVVVAFGQDLDAFCVDAPRRTAPDVISGVHNQLGPLVACNAVAPVPSWAWTASSRKEYLASAVKAASIAGKPVFMPTSADTTGILYNRAMVGPGLFKPLKGDRYPRWTTLIAKALALTKGGIYGYLQPFELYYNYAFLRAFGGYVFGHTRNGYNYRDVGLGSAGTVKGLQFLKDLSTTGKYKLVPTTMDQSTEQNLFSEGKAAMILDGPWGAPLGTSVQFGFAPLPSMDGIHPMHPFMSYYGYSVNRLSRHTNEAFSLVAYLTRRIPQLEMTNAYPDMPVIKSLLRSRIAHASPFIAGEAAAVATGDPMPNIPEMAQVWAPADAAIQAVIKGQDTPDAAARTAVAAIQAAIAKEHGG